MGMVIFWRGKGTKKGGGGHVGSEVVFKGIIIELCNKKYNLFFGHEMQSKNCTVVSYTWNQRNITKKTLQLKNGTVNIFYKLK